MTMPFPAGRSDNILQNYQMFGSLLTVSRVTKVIENNPIYNV